ncbi:MAG: 2-phospho-L-lactate guanylyltransferase [Anaerolineales bacterium]
MAIWAIVPVKPLKRAKSRLATVLSADQREALSRNLLVHTLQVLRDIDELERTVVVSRDPAALHLAREYDAYTLAESGSPELNLTLQRATDMAKAFNARSVLVLATDLPMISRADIRAMFAAAPGTGPAVVVAPDRDAAGTNALFVRPAGLLQYHFGRDSVRLHVEHAEDAGARVTVCKRVGLQMDIHGPADLKSLPPVIGAPFLLN